MLSDLIKQARDDAGLSQLDLAQKIGASVRSISLWETTDREPDFRFVRLIARATDKPLSFFDSDRKDTPDASSEQALQ